MGCIDARVPPEIIFDQDIGNVFVGRVAGNVEDENILGSIEYAVKVKHIKLIVVLGHSKCGAIQSTIDNVKMGYVTQLTEQIKPACKHHHNGLLIPEIIIEETAKENIFITMKEIYEKSEIIKHAVDENKTQIIGAYYNIENGEVEFLNKEVHKLNAIIKK